MPHFFTLFTADEQKPLKRLKGLQKPERGNHIPKSSHLSSIFGFHLNKIGRMHLFTSRFSFFSYPVFSPSEQKSPSRLEERLKCTRSQKFTCIWLNVFESHLIEVAVPHDGLLGNGELWQSKSLHWVDPSYFDFEEGLIWEGHPI